MTKKERFLSKNDFPRYGVSDRVRIPSQAPFFVPHFFLLGGIRKNKPALISNSLTTSLEEHGLRLPLGDTLRSIRSF